VRQRAAPGHRQQIQPHREDHDQHQPEPERRHRLAEQREQHAREIDQAILLDRGEHARRHRE
jgi:hypothetical protein